MRTWIFWPVVLLIILILRGVAYIEPGPCDPYFFAYAGAKWVDGWLPYVGLFDNKPPGILALNAFAFAISRAHQWLVMYVFEALLAVLTATCLAGMVRRWSGRPYDQVVVLLAVPLAFGLRFAYSGNMTEGFQVAWVVAGLWIITARGTAHSAAWYLAGGCLIGLGSLFKPTGLAAAVAVVIWLATEWLAGRIDLRRALSRAGALLGGVILPWLLGVAWFAWHGAAADMLYSALAYNRHYGQEVWRTRGAAWVVLNSYQELWPALPILAAAGYVVLTVLRPTNLVTRGETQPNWRLLAVLWMLGDLGGALAGGRSYEHYFVPLTISASAVAGFVLADAGRSLTGLAEANHAKRIGLSVLMLWVALLIGRDAVWGASLLRSGGRSSEGQGRYELAQAARRLAKPRDTLFTWGSAAYFYYEAGLDPICPEMDAHRAYDFDAKAEQIGIDLLAALKAHPPRFVITDVNEDHPQRQQPDLLRAYRVFKWMLQSEYRQVLRRGPRALHVRIETPSALSSPASAPSASDRSIERPSRSKPATQHAR